MNIQPVNLQDFFRLEYRSGAIRSLLTEERMHLVPTNLWEGLNEKLVQELHEDAPPTIHLIGYSLGSAFIGELKKNISEPEALTRHFTDFAAAAGWGVISMAGDLRQGGRYLVSVMNCAFCENVAIGQTPVCTFLASTIEGMADKIYGAPHRVSETRCSAKGEAICQFTVEASPRGSEPAPGPSPLAISDWESLCASAIPAILLSGSRTTKY